MHIQLKERHGEACEQVEGEGALEILHCYRLPIVYDFAPTQDSEVEIDKNVENEEAVEQRVDDQCGHLTGTHSHDQCGQGEGGQGGKSGDSGAGEGARGEAVMEETFLIVLHVLRLVQNILRVQHLNPNPKP